MSPTAADPPFPPPLAGTKRPLVNVSTAKRLRSKVPRRKRIPLSPVVAGNAKRDIVPDLEEEESSSSCFHSEVSFDSEAMSRSRIAKSKVPLRSRRSADALRRITRSYSRKKELMKSEVPEVSNGDASSDIQVSDVTQTTGATSGANLKARAEKLQQISESSFSEAQPAKISSSVADDLSSVQVGGDLAVGKQEAHEIDLACYEQLSDADSEDSEYSTCDVLTLSEMEGELFYGSSEGESSDLFISSENSSENFSEKSSQDSTPSAAFSLFKKLATQFLKLSFGMDFKEKSDSSQDLKGREFDEKDEEESYKCFRSSERNEVVLHDYGENYSVFTDSGELILRQRLLMVNWIVEYSEEMELQHETLFLGVSLMDRFLSRGYFDTEKNLQLLGIASITLAARLEEVQPWNSVRKRSFKVGKNVYYRHEVVAMEWLLLDVLSFHCMLPTTHNFLPFYLKAAKADAEVESLTRYLAVISLLDHERLNFWPSTVAAGLVILACLATKRDSSCARVMETHVRTKSDDLPECIQSLEWLVKYVC